MSTSLPTPLSCPMCAANMPETSAFCPACGSSMQGPLRASGRVGVFPESIAGALAYFTIIPAIVFFFLKPYNKNRFVRFHSLQCIALWILGLVLALVLKVASYLLALIPIVGPLLVVLSSVLLILAGILLWLVLIVKALQGEMFHVPIVGDLAEQIATFE
jgi:uncharacterized membrane protein